VWFLVFGEENTRLGSASLMLVRGQGEHVLFDAVSGLCEMSDSILGIGVSISIALLRSRSPFHCSAFG
jgi:hypothetical protein